MKYFGKILFAGLAVFFGVAALFLLQSQSQDPGQVNEVSSGVPSQAVIGSEVFTLEIADSDEGRARGLGYRDNLCPNCGMLFLFDSPGQYAFWMRGMRFPLDIIWLQGTEVVFIARSVDPASLETIVPTGTADRVLEVNAGKAQGLQEGDRIEWR